MKKSPRRAAKHYKKACSLGERFSCRELAEAYSRGKLGITPDVALYYKYLGLTCGAGLPMACMRLKMACLKRKVQAACSALFKNRQRP